MSIKEVVEKYAAKAVAVGTVVVAVPSFAVDDYSAITTAVDWSTVGAAIITIFAAGAAVLVSFVGGKFLLRAIRGA